MANKNDLKLKSPMVEEYGANVQEAFERGKQASIERYRAILFMYKAWHEAVVEKEKAEAKVKSIIGKLKLIDRLFKDSALTDVKAELESKLVLAKAAFADVKIPDLNWDKLGESQMWR